MTDTKPPSAEALEAARKHFGIAYDDLDQCEIEEIAITLDAFAEQRADDERRIQSNIRRGHGWRGPR